MRRLLAGAALSVLAACAGIGPILPGGEAPTALPMFGGGVVATGPSGYCVDPVASRPVSGFAVIAPCAAINGEGAVPAIIGVATIQFGASESAAVTGEEAALATLLASEAGKGLLSRTGAATEIAIREVETGPGVVTVSFSDTAPPAVPGLEGGEFRGFLDLGGRLVTVSVRGLADEPLSGSSGALLLSRFITALRSANSGGSSGAGDS